MTPTAWRVVAPKFAGPPYDPFDGEGSLLNGGRWNSPGVPVVYTAASVSLAMLEVLLHAEELAALAGLVMFPVGIPPDLITAIDPDAVGLPADWHRPETPLECRRLGDDWVRRAETPVLRVPSAVVTVEHNYVLYPRHPLFGRLVIGSARPLPIDPRLLKA